MRENEEREFIDNYKAAYKKNVLPKLNAKAQSVQHGDTIPWDKRSIQEKVEILARMSVAHENALKEFGPVLGLVMEVLTKEGMLEKAETKDAVGRKVTQWRIKSGKIMIQKKGEEKHEL